MIDRKKWKTWKSILLAFASVCVAFAGAELATRAVFPWLACPVLKGMRSVRYHHVMPPNRTMCQGSIDGAPIFIRTNEDGLRTEYSRAEFLKYPTRVMVMGDSYVFGWAVDEKFTMPEVMERLLRERLKRNDIAVLNTANISYSPFLMVLAFDGFLKEYKPNVVLFVLDATDFADDYQYSHEAKWEDGTPRFWPTEGKAPPYYGAAIELVKPFLAKGAAAVMRPIRAAARRIGIRWDEVSDEGYSEFRMNEKGLEGENRYFIYRHPPEITRPFFESTYENVEALAKDVEASGAKFVCIVSPRFQHWNPKECPDNWEKNYKVKEPYQDEYLKFFDSKKTEAPFEIFDLLPAFKETKEFPLVFSSDPHWNKNGHALVARTLVDRLVANGTVK